MHLLIKILWLALLWVVVVSLVAILFVKCYNIWTSLLFRGLSKKKSTKEAKMLGDELGRLGFSPVFEWWDGRKHVDIALLRERLLIEVDGSQHYTDSTQILADLSRSACSRRAGFETLYIPNGIVRLDCRGVAEAVAAVCKSRA